MTAPSDPHEVWEGLPACHACGFVSPHVHVIPAYLRMVECERCGHQGVYLGEPNSPERTPRLRVVDPPHDPYNRCEGTRYVLSEHDQTAPCRGCPDCRP